MSTNNRSLRLLALDGGGVRGLSELYILNEIMLRIQKNQNLASPPKPCELFDLICGTSTGGLIALMLGRLQMSVDQVISEYCNFAKAVFGKPKNHASEGRFQATTFENVIRDTVKNYGKPQDKDGKADPNLVLLEEQASNVCPVFVCSRNARAMDAVRLFRSYRSYTTDEYEDMAIWEAARATSAAPTFFKRLKKGPNGAQEEFLDGGMGSNNPTKILIEEAVRKFASDDPVSCIVSIGTGKTRLAEFKSPGWFQKTIPLDLIDALKAMTTDCETTAAELEKRFSSRPRIYFRFNVEHGLEDVRMDEWKDLGNTKAKTVAYLAQHTIGRAIDEAADALHARDPRILIEDLDSTLKVSASLIDNKARSIPKCIVPFERKVSCFIGRTDVLDDIHAVFDRADTGHLKITTVVLRTMGGQGKTQVALEYCSRAMNEDYDYILWVNAETQTSFKQSFSTFAERLRQSRTTEAAVMLESVAKDISMLDTIRERLIGKKYLMVIDNLDMPSEHRDVKNCMTLGGTGHIIITSRHIDAERLGSLITLPAFSVQEGSDLLTRRSNREESSDDAQNKERIVFELGGLPLGLDQAALLIREKNLTYLQFLKEFQNVRTTLLNEDLPEFWEYEKLIPGDAEEPEMRMKIGIQTTWTMSYEYLGNQAQGELKCHLLTLSAYLSSTTISQATFSPFLKQVRETSEIIGDAFLKSPYKDSFKEAFKNDIEVLTLAEAFHWAQPLLEEAHTHSISGTFPDFIRDAYKVGLVTSTRYNETLGTVYSMHPLVSRWLVNQDNNNHIIEAFFIVHHLLDHSDDYAAAMSFTLEVNRHVTACIGLNKQLPESGRLGTGNLYYVGKKLYTYALIFDLPHIEDVIPIIMAALHYSESTSEDLEDLKIESWGMDEVYALGSAFQLTKKLDEAKKFLQLAIARQVGKSLKTVVEILPHLVEVCVQLQDEALLSSVCQSLLDCLTVKSHHMSPSQSSDYCEISGRALPESFEDNKITADSFSMSKAQTCFENLPDGFWLRTFHEIGFSFRPRYDLGKIAILKFLSKFEQNFPDRKMAELQKVVVAVRYILGVLDFALQNWQEAQDQLQSVIQVVQAGDTTDFTIAIELGSSTFAAAAARKLDNATPHTMVYLAREKFSSAWSGRTLSQVQTVNVQNCFTYIIALQSTILAEPSEKCWNLNYILMNCLLPRAGGKTPAESTRDALYLKLFSGSFAVEDLHKAEEHLQLCVNELGHCEDTVSAYDVAHGMAYALGEWRVCLRLTYEHLQRVEANGEEPDIFKIQSLGRAYLNLKEYDKYRQHQERYPNVDWSRVEKEEQNRTFPKAGRTER